MAALTLDRVTKLYGDHVAVDALSLTEIGRAHV